MQMMIPKTSNGDDYLISSPANWALPCCSGKEGRIDAARLYALLSSIFALFCSCGNRLSMTRWPSPMWKSGALPEKSNTSARKRKGEFGIMGKLFEALSFIRFRLVPLPSARGDFSRLHSHRQKRPATVYLIVPGRSTQLYAPFAWLMIGVAMLYKGRKPQSLRVVFLLDEAAQLGHFEMLKLAFSYKRGGGVRTWAFFQSVR